MRAKTVAGVIGIGIIGTLLSFIGIISSPEAFTPEKTEVPKEVYVWSDIVAAPVGSVQAKRAKGYVLTRERTSSDMEGDVPEEVKEEVVNDVIATVKAEEPVETPPAVETIAQEAPLNVIDFSNYGTEEVTEDTVENTEEKLPEPETDTVGDEIVQFSTDTPPDKRAKFYELYHKEPASIRQFLVDKGAIIRVAPDGRFTNGHAGEYWFATKLININAGSDKKLAMAVNHEIGHFIDETLGLEAGMPVEAKQYTNAGNANTWYSNCDVFQGIYGAEIGGSGYPSWNSTCSPEFFAETYRYVIEGNNAMLSRVPLAAEFVRTVIREMFEDTGI